MTLKRLIVLLSLLPAAAAPSAVSISAQAAEPDKRPKPPDSATVKAALESGDEARILTTLKQIEASGDQGRPLAGLVEAFLKRGSTPKALTRALAVSGGLAQPSSSAVIAPYVRHRVELVRRTAAQALIKTRGPIAVKTLRLALRHRDAALRGIAASGLGELKDRSALPDLFTAFDKGVVEASSSIGQLCSAAECEEFAKRLGKQPLDVMTAGFDQILFRPPDQMPDEQKLRVIGRLRELGTQEAGKFLADVSARWPKAWSPRVKAALESAVKASGGKSD